jgi:hypothetical protein
MKNLKNKTQKVSSYSYMLLTLFLMITLWSCSDEDDCVYIENFDCINLNIGDPCDSNDDGNLDGIINDFCECIPESEIISECPGFFQNGDFENLAPNSDPNEILDNDIDLALGWKPLWQSGSLADLFDNSTTNFGLACFDAPVPSSGVFAGMWVENNPNSGGSPSFREGFFNELNAVVNSNSGIYTLSFDYASMSQDCFTSNDIKVGIYGINFPSGSPLPINPFGAGIPSNLDLFGATNTVFIGEIIISSSSTNNWTSVSFNIDTSTLTCPVTGVNHIMITNSHLPFPDYGRMFVGFDNFCLVN